MRYLIKILTLLLFAAVIVSPAMGIVTNVSDNGSKLTLGSYTTSSFLHDPNYMPREYVYAFITIGIVCLAVSRIFKQAEDIFSIVAVAPFGMAMWFANYMTIEQVDILGFCDPAATTGAISTINTQIITPNPYLSLTMGIFFVVSLINVVWIFYLQPADKGTTGE